MQLNKSGKKSRQVSSIFSLCENNETDALHHMHTHSLGIPAIYERLSSFPLQSAHSVTPVTLARLWQSRDLPLRLTAASWQHACHNSRETFLLHLYSPGAAALLQEHERQRGRERSEGRESVPLGSSAVTTPARPGKESAPLTSPRRSAAPRYISSVFTQCTRGEGRWIFGAELVAPLPQHKVA